MTRMLAHLELLQEYGARDPELADLIQSLANQAHGLRHMVTLLMAADYLTSELPYQRRRPVAIIPLLARLLGEYQTLHADRPFQLQVANPPLTAGGDEQAIEIVFETLLDNAIKYSPHRSAIEVWAGDDPQVNRLVFHVQDFGQGIPPDKQSALFDESASPTLGHGLGLKFARRLVSSMGGQIWVESQVGGSTTFSFSLPRHA